MGPLNLGHKLPESEPKQPQKKKKKSLGYFVTVIRLTVAPPNSVLLRTPSHHAGFQCMNGVWEVQTPHEDPGPSVSSTCPSSTGRCLDSRLLPKLNGEALPLKPASIFLIS